MANPHDDRFEPRNAAYWKRECARLTDECQRLRGLLGEPLRVVVVQAIREATGCPDLIGRDGECLSEKVLSLAKELLLCSANDLLEPLNGMSKEAALAWVENIRKVGE